MECWFPSKCSGTLNACCYNAVKSPAAYVLGFAVYALLQCIDHRLMCTPWWFRFWMLCLHQTCTPKPALNLLFAIGVWSSFEARGLPSAFKIIFLLLMPVSLHCLRLPGCLIFVWLLWLLCFVFNALGHWWRCCSFLRSCCFAHVVCVMWWLALSVLWLTFKKLNCLRRWESLIGVFPDTSSKRRRTRRCVPYKLVMYLTFLSSIHIGNKNTGGVLSHFAKHWERGSQAFP